MSTHALTRQFRHPAAYRQRPARAGMALQSGLMALAFAAAVYGSSQWIHPAWSFVALVNYLWLCTLLFRIEPRGCVLLLPQFINTLSSMIALIMIEYGGEMFELGLVGRPGPWSNALNLYNAAFYAGALVTFRPIARMLARRGEYGLTPVMDRYANLLAWMVLGLTALIVAVLIFRGLQAGFPLLAGTDRFAFRRFAADKITLYALNLKFVISYALGFLAFTLPLRRTLRFAAAAMFAATLVLNFLFGDKFFTQLTAITAFLAPYIYANYRTVTRRIWAYGAGALLALGAVGTVTTYIYSNGFTETSAATTKRLAGRMVGQGELWFLQASIGAPLLDWNGLVIDRYVASLRVKAIDLYAAQNSLGANYFSNRYAPDYLRASLHRNAGSVTYTAVTEAMGLVLFGWIGAGLMMFAMGALMGLVSGYIAFAIENRSVLSGVFAAYISVQVRGSIVQAAPWVIGSIYSLRWLTVILTVELLLLIMGQGRGKSPAGRMHRRTRLPRRKQHAPEPAV